MNRTSSKDFLNLLRLMSKKGFYDILNHVKNKGGSNYNAILKHALEKKYVESRASITIILNGLTDLGLLERNVSSTRPIRTTYQISEKGEKILVHLKEMESLI